MYGHVKLERKRMSYTHRGMTLPDHIQESLDAYVVAGRPLGSFLGACVDNNLSKACAHADDNNLPILCVIVAYLYNETPSGCWGHRTAYSDWIVRKRREREEAAVKAAL